MLSPPLHIRVFGPLAVLRGDLRIHLAGKQKVLLALLAAHEHDEINRSRIAGWLWPTNGSASGRHSLSQALYSIKRAGLGDAVRASTETVALAGHVTSDLRNFKDFVTKQDWREAANQVGGILLSDLGARSDPLDEWVDKKRHEIFTSMANVAQHLCDNLEFEAALRIAQLALRHDPWDRSVVEIVLQAFAGMGRREEAEVFASQTIEGWSAEFQETITLKVPHYLDTTADAKLSNPFVGRQPELKLLSAAWARAKDRTFCASFMIGEAGIGKTAIARRFQRLVALRGGKTAWAAGYVLERQVAFGVLEQWLRELSPPTPDGSTDHFSSFLGTVLPGLPPELEPLEVGRQRIHAALARHVARAAEVTPMCLILDDLQWADDASLAFLHYLKRYHRSLPVLFVGTARGDASVPLIRELDGSERLHLQPLSLADTAKLVELKRDLLPEQTPLPYTPRQIHERTGGNPLLVTSLLADAAFMRGEAREFPSSVVEFFLPRMNSLTTTAKVMLAAFGIFPDPPRDSLHQIVGVDLRSCEDGLQELLRAQFIRDLPGGLRVSHGLSAELALTVLPPAIERQLRGRVARILQKEGRSSAAVLAAQFDVSGQKERAFEAAVTAASAAADLFAHKEAEFFYKLALSNAQLESDAAQVRLSLANLFLATRRTDEAREILHALNLHRMGSAKALEVQVLRTIVDLSGAMDTSVVAHGRGLLDTIEGGPAADLAARLALAIASTVHAQGDPDNTLDYCSTRTKQLLEFVVDPRLRVEIAVRLGALVAMSESYERGISQIDSVAAEAAKWPDTMAVCLAARGSACVAAGRLAEAERDFLSAAELMERTGTYESISMVANNLGVCYQEQGRFSEAASQYDIALKIRDQSDAPSWVQVTYDNLGILLYEKGEYEAAVEVSNQGLASIDNGTASVRSFISRQSIKGLSCLKLGRRIEAQECRREIALAKQRQEFWSNDISYVEIFMAQMAEIDGSIELAVSRLKKCMHLYEQRDFLCCRRMEIEVLRLTVNSDPGTVLQRADSLRLELAASGAKNMVSRIDSVIARAKLRHVSLASRCHHASTIHSHPRCSRTKDGR